MTDQQRKWIEELSHCSFYPGSYDKRFVRDLASQPRDKELTEKQAAFLERIAWRYRKQRGDPNMARPEGSWSERDVTRDQEKLKAWNEGKKL